MRRDVEDGTGGGEEREIVGPQVVQHDVRELDPEEQRRQDRLKTPARRQKPLRRQTHPVHQLQILTKVFRDVGRGRFRGRKGGQSPFRFPVKGDGPPFLLWSPEDPKIKVAES
jgi:hypothetical protein